MPHEYSNVPVFKNFFRNFLILCSPDAEKAENVIAHNDVTSFPKEQTNNNMSSGWWLSAQQKARANLSRPCNYKIFLFFR